MKNFEITTNRTLTTRVVIEADSQADAEAKYQDMVTKGEIAVLESEQGEETYSEYFVVDKSDEPISYTPWKDNDAVEGREYARACSITGEGMNEGWVVSGGETYIKYEEDAIAFCRTEYDQTMEEAYAESEESDDDLFYWTNWESDDYQYIYLNGILTDKEEQ